MATKKKQQSPRAKRRTAKPNVSSLIAAARKGDLDKIRDFISQGMNVNSVSGGVALNCALGGASEKGRADAVRMLLESGADPNNTLLPKHATFPLDWAVFARSVECARLLLEAGANPNRCGWDDETALDSAKIYNNREMVDLLKKFGAVTGSEAGKTTSFRRPLFDSGADDKTAVVNLAREANNPSFSEWLTKISTESDSIAEALHTTRGGYSLTVSRDRANKVLNDHSDDVRKSGFCLFRATTSISEGNHRIILLPTADPYVAVRAMRTNAANYDLSTADIIRWLRALEESQPFVLEGIGRDFIEGSFATTLSNLKELADQIYKFAPDVVDQGTETVQRLAAEIKKTKKFFLWWD